jgi:hypothetical protein
LIESLRLHNAALLEEVERGRDTLAGARAIRDGGNYSFGAGGIIDKHEEAIAVTDASGAMGGK